MVDHPAILRGLSFGRVGNTPTILQRTEQEFIPALLHELSHRDGLSLTAAAAVSPRIPDNLVSRKKRRATRRTATTPESFAPVLQLLQPVHRAFNLVVLEAVCDRPGSPRLDPKRIDSAGVVVRRVVARDRITKRRSKGHLVNSGPESFEGWMQSGKRFRGWIELLSPQQERLDPEPSRRRAELRSGNPEVDRLLSEWHRKTELFTESVSPLFVAPPDVCKATNRTILYGLVPVASSETSDGPEGDEGSQGISDAAFDVDELSARLPSHLPYYLQPVGQGWSAVVPRAGEELTSVNAEDSDLKAFVLTLRQLRFEFDAFGDSRESKALFNELNRIFIESVDLPMGEFLESAAQVLLNDAGSNNGSIRMPDAWPSIDRNESGRILTLVTASLARRLAGLAGRESRYADSSRLYKLRAFVRVKRADGCPPDLIWSDYSEPFAIAPWYDSGDQPPVQVTLPDVNEDFLKKVKPNVAFVLPENLMNLLNRNSPKDFLDGAAGSGGGGIGLDWICGFSIPLITLCAFIVLNIFLQLFNIVFQWLFFIKICIPFPRKK